MSTVIEVENISKQYRLGVIGATTIRDDLKRTWAKMLGKEDPTLKIGTTNNLSNSESRIENRESRIANPESRIENRKSQIRNQKSDYVWALQDINFKVEQGEAIGIIGKNGAGKSTLLKILSKVTGPTLGDVKVRGRIASLLEVGTGFHPELTGKENIFLNGAILGMSKAEIKSKLDEIIDFSGVEKYIDTPVKRYSSGMYVRLAFAVAAYLESEILVIDEVLAVGDAEFQKKCLGKMGDVAKSGRTVLFVSHNMTAISELCNRTIFIKQGQVSYNGDTKIAIEKYFSTSQMGGFAKDFSENKDRKGSGKMRFTKYKIIDENENEIDFVLTGQNITFVLDFEVHTENILPPLHFAIMFTDKVEKPFFHISNSVSAGEEFTFNKAISKGSVRCNIPKFPLHTGEYYFTVYCGTFGEAYDVMNFAGKVNVEAGNFYSSGKLPYRVQGDLLVDNRWTIEI